MPEILTWEFLATIGGQAFVVSVATQMIKLSLPAVLEPWQTNGIAAGLALLVVLSVAAFTGPATAERLALAALSWPLVVAVAIGGYEVARNMLGRRS